MKQELLNLACKVYCSVYSFFHPIENKIVFSSFFGKQYSDNPRAISERLHEKYPEINITWIMPADRERFPFMPEYITVINKNRRDHAELKAILTAGVYVYNCELKDNIKKRKQQLFIQTWHGDLPFKKVLYDADNGVHSSGTIADNKYTDFCIAGCDLGVAQYKSAFKYNGEILKIGTPRNDKLITITPSEQKEIRKSLGINDNKKILIYAPTFRDGNKGGQEVLVDLEQVMDHLGNKGDWVCLVRSHVASGGFNSSFDSERFIDVSSYFDMADILAVGDLLITDYSSCAGDFIRRGKGTILAIFDLEEYECNCRQFVFDLKTSGFLCANNMKALLDIIDEYNDDDYAKNCDYLCKRYGVIEHGDASDIVCEKIIDHINTIKKRMNI